MKTNEMIDRTISPYEIVEKIVQGHMSMVYKATDTKLGRTVALKFLAWHASNDEEAKTRFLGPGVRVSVAALLI